MRQFKIIFYILLFTNIIHNTSYSQSSAFIEWKYLELTNLQNDASLSADNYRNAELVADSLVFNQNESYPNSHFFIELSRSYAINNESGLQAFSLLRQHCLYPNDSLNVLAINLFVEACLKMQIDKEKAIKIYKDANIANNFKSYSDKLNLLIESAIQLYDTKTDAIVMRYLEYYQSLGRKPSFQTLQWAFLTKIKLGDNKKAKSLALNKGITQPNIWQIDNSKLQKRIVMRAEHYYAKENAKGEAKYFLSEYKKLDINIFNRFQMAWRRIILPIR